jgi:hypothetical protein
VLRLGVTAIQAPLMEAPPTENEPLDPQPAGEPPNPEGGSSPESPPRPAIVHLLGWTAATAVVLFDWRIHEQGSLSSTWPASRIVLTLLSAMVHGAALGVLAMALFRRWRGQAFPSQPGEWFLVAYSSGQVLQRVLQYVIETFAPPRNPADLSWLGIGTIVLTIVPYIVALMRGGGGINWRAVFLTLIGIQSLYIIYYTRLLISNSYNAGIVFWLIGGSTFIWLAVAIAAVTIDVVRKMHRGWVHNIGAAVLGFVSKHSNEVVS